MPSAAPTLVNDFPEPAPHLSEAARRYFRETFSRAERDAMDLPSLGDADAWRRRNAEELTRRAAGNGLS